jgi:hypothetical protein
MVIFVGDYPDVGDSKSILKANTLQLDDREADHQRPGSHTYISKSQKHVPAQTLRNRGELSSSQDVIPGFPSPEKASVGREMLWLADDSWPLTNWFSSGTMRSYNVGQLFSDQSKAMFTNGTTHHCRTTSTRPQKIPRGIAVHGQRGQSTGHGRQNGYIYFPQHVSDNWRLFCGIPALSSRTEVLWSDLNDGGPRGDTVEATGASHSEQ